MTIPKWKAIETLWDVLELNGVRFPGIWTLDVKASRKFQIDKGSGEDGNTLTNDGYEGSRISAKGNLWTDAQVAELNAILATYNPRSLGGTIAPVTIVHPIASMLGLRAIVISQWALSTPNASYFTPRFEAIEWFPEPEPTPALPPAPAPNASDPSNPSSGGGGLDLTPPAPDPNFEGGRAI